MEVIFYSHANKLTHFHKIGFALVLVSSWKWQFLELGNGLLRICIPQYFHIDALSCQYFKDKNIAFSQIVWYIFHEIFMLRWVIKEFAKSHYEFCGQMGYIETLTHPIHPTQGSCPTPPIAKFQLSILLSKRLHTRILAGWVSRFPVGTTKKKIYFCTSWVKNTVLNLSIGNEFMFWQICLSRA